MRSSADGPAVRAHRGVSRRGHLFATTAMAGCLFWGAATGAQAPSETVQAAAIDETPIESVVISAQKRSVKENAQRVPIALTALTGVELEDRHVSDLRDLSTPAPNVTFLDAGTVPGFANFTIRGLGINSTIPSVEPAVGVFVDGVYMGVAAGVMFDLFDVDDIEILRGPQGLLFGHSTTGGAVLINTRRPGDTFAVHGRFNYETGPQETGAVSIEGPIGSQFRAKLAGYYSNDDGWFTNRFDGRSFGASRSGFVRPTIVWTPSVNFDSTLIYERGWVRGDGAVAQNPAYFQGFDVSVNNRGYDRRDWDGVTLQSNLHVSQGVFTNVLAYRQLDQDASADIDARPISGFHAFNVLHQHQTSEELRYSGSLSDQIDITAGLYYFGQSYLYLERRLLAGGAIDATMGANVDNTNYAAFFQGDYRLTPAFTAIAGARFTREEKTADIATFVPSTAGSRCNFNTEVCHYNFPGPAFPNSPGSDTWENLAPKLGFQWQADQDALVYGHWTRGVRSGGYNVRNTSTSIPPGPYDPEVQDAFEVGLKSEWFNRRLIANAAAFYNTIDNMQRDVNLTDPVLGVVQVTRNTADATIKGLELELTGAVTDELTLFGNAGYLDGNYDAVFFDLDGGGIGASDLALQIPRLSKWSYGMGAAYNHNWGSGFATRMRVDYGYRSRVAFTDSNTAYLTPIENLSADVALVLPDEHWTLSLYGRNLLDKVMDAVNSPLPASLGGGSFRTLNEGRVIGIQASFTY